MENFMAKTEAKKTVAKMGLYLVSPEQKPVTNWPSHPKDALPSEGHYSCYARKYMEAQSARSIREAGPIKRKSDY